MDRGESRRSPSDLARGRSQFRRDVVSLGGVGGFPVTVWAMAGRLAKVHGVGRTAETLGLDYDRLKTGAEAVDEQPHSSGPNPSLRCLRRSSARRACLSSTTVPGPRCACNWWATTRPMSRPVNGPESLRG